ncbi:MAG: hypothetical protein M1827_000964 [Pycnora praestabilis]|nr:MAG: hypothetical protein M1827_000964 [Pycnora praestabilis]
MSSIRQTATYGNWKSPITADLISGKSISLEGLSVNESNGKIYYLEGRPAEDGRSCIVEHSDHGAKDILPKSFSARTQVHEYGGASFTVNADGDLIFADWETKGVFALNPANGDHHPIIEADPEVYYADFNAHPIQTHLVLAIREDHHSKSVENSVVVLNAKTKKVHQIAYGADFYSHPQFSPDGKKVCWTQWDHPDMPWIGTVLYIADWHDEKVVEATIVAGKAGIESVTEPRWGSDGTLFFGSDRSGYWQLYRLDKGMTEPRHIKLNGLEETEFTGPEWWFGKYDSTRINKMIAMVTKNAASTLIIIDLAKDTFTNPNLPLILPLFHFDAVRRVSDTAFVVIASTATAPPALYYIDVETLPQMNVLRSSAQVDISSSLYSKAEHISFPRTYGEDKKGLAHALFLTPKNPEYEPPADKLPPLIVHIHGGPTLHTTPALNLELQYWTSRGYAIADVNYAGSTGYGRTYRELLDTKWGISDIADAASCVAYLASSGHIDPSRVGIVGGSAGGYAVLQALCVYPEIWAGGVSLYGISSLKALVEDTHKFESQYLFKLLFEPGTSDDEKEKIYRDRSPLYHAGKITAPVLLLQGSEDKVVPPNQAREMEEIIKKNGGDAEVIVFEGEGHGFRQAANVKRSIEEEEKWWVRTLLRL